jgi:hypothetical protein
MSFIFNLLLNFEPHINRVPFLVTKPVCFLPELTYFNFTLLSPFGCEGYLIIYSFPQESSPSLLRPQQRI